MKQLCEENDIKKDPEYILCKWRGKYRHMLDIIKKKIWE